VGAAAAAAAAKDAPDSASKRRRLTEKEEDAQLLRTDAAELPPTTRLLVQPANIQGAMRAYQLEGLNFLISLFERGVNGILADEMGLVRGATRGEWGWSDVRRCGCGGGEVGRCGVCRGGGVWGVVVRGVWHVGRGRRCGKESRHRWDGTCGLWRVAQLAARRCGCLRGMRRAGGGGRALVTVT